MLASLCTIAPCTDAQDGDDAHAEDSDLDDDEDHADGKYSWQLLSIET